jgi:3-phosphoshikimate 1-carboxyvinyltransferase
MRVRVNPHNFSGTVRIPASKSHTIRQLLIASLADGVSQIHFPLDSLDTRSCISACKIFGAEINETGNETGIAKLEIKGNGGFKKKTVLPGACIDVGNSGTTLYLALAAAGLQNNEIKFTGDEQIKKRSAAPLLDALAGLGIKCESVGGCAPISIKGPWKGGRVSLPCPTSQYLSALLIASPLAPAGTVTEISVPLLNEKPYIEMTLSYLKAQGIPFEAAPDFSRFVIPGGSAWKTINRSVPADFSSAAFPAAAAAITGGSVTLLGLDPQDTQGDKFFLEMLKSMGCEVSFGDGEDGKTVTVSRGGTLRGGTFDLNETPDLLPAAAAVAAFAEGDTALVNVAHARIKETDRIAVMAGELAKLGVKCTERPDGLVIHGNSSLFPSPYSPFPVIDGHGDHRIVMAFACAALGSPVPVEITSAESAAVTYPGFLQLLDAEEAG